MLSMGTFKDTFLIQRLTPALLGLMLTLPLAEAHAKKNFGGFEILGGGGRAFSRAFADIGEQNFGRYNLLRNNLSQDANRRLLGTLDHLNREAPSAMSRGGRASLYTLYKYWGFGFSLTGAQVRLENIAGPDNIDINYLLLYLVENDHWSGPPQLLDAFLLRRHRKTAAWLGDATFDLYLGTFNKRKGDLFLRLSLGLGNTVVPGQGGLAEAAVGFRTPSMGAIYLAMEAYTRVSANHLQTTNSALGRVLYVRDSGIYFGVGFR